MIENNKKISLDTIFFIEDVVSKYELEKDLIENDQPLKEKILKSKSPAERLALKFSYSKLINDNVKRGIPLKDFLPSIKLINILDGFLNKKFALSELSSLIAKELKISLEKAQAISEYIKKNQEKIKEDIDEVRIDAASNDITDIKNLDEVSIKNKKGIGYEFLK